MSVIARPIIGPPNTMRAGVDFRPPHCATISEIGMPMGANTLLGTSTASPEMVITRCVSGRPKRSASKMAMLVATFCTRTPTSADNLPLGT